MKTKEQFSYDAVPYPSKFFLQTHPDRLATAGMLFGLQSAKPEACRVLELGCGNGSNLVAHAFGLPNASFVGIDLSEKHVEMATASAAELDLTNIKFRKMDVMEMKVDDFGEYDYITAHGLFSWVPDPVREKVLSLFSEMLRPNGIGYISYNAYPGAHAREMVRSLMLFHTRDVSDPQEMVDRSISLLELLAETTTDQEVYRHILKFELQRHHEHSVQDIYHDDLSDAYRPFYFHEFASRLTQNGMQFLSEAELHGSSRQGLSEDAVAFLDRIEDPILAEQYLDLFRGRVFRQTLFCRDNIDLKRIPNPSVLDKLFLSSTLRPVEKITDIAERKVERFISAKGQRMQIDHPLTKAALLRLGEVWGRSIGTTDLLNEANQQLVAADSPSLDREKEFETTRNILLQIALGSDMIELHSYAPKANTEAGSKPKVNRLSRWQLRDSNNVMTLLIKDLKLNDNISRHLLELMDGTKTKPTLIREMQSFIRAQKDVPDNQDLIRDMPGWLDESIGTLARLGALES